MPFEKKFTQQSSFPLAAHPGHMIIEYFDQVPVNTLPGILGCSQKHFDELITFKPDVGLTRLMCLRLAHHFKTSYEFWDNIQRQYDEAFLFSQEEFLVADLYPDKSDKEWKYYDIGEYQFSNERGINSLPIRTKSCGLKTTNNEYMDIFEVWLNNTWTSPTRILMETYLHKE